MLFLILSPIWYNATGAPGMKHIPRFSTDSLSRNYPEPEEVPAPGARWVVVRDMGVVVTTSPAPTILLDRYPASSGMAVNRSQYLGHLGSTPVYAAEIPGAAPLPGSMVYSGVRELSGTIPDEELALAGIAVQIIGFDRTTRFCGVCGEGMRQLRTERAKRCPACGHTEYPRLSPAIIVLVRNADSVLMVQSKQAPAGRHSLVAGFVEPGEDLVHAVHREVMEETGIRITNVSYAGSEPWPFPNSLMIAFVADYDGGGIEPDGTEVVSAGWFRRDNLPSVPPKLSIARSLIDWWVENGTRPDSR